MRMNLESAKQSLDELGFVVLRNAVPNKYIDDALDEVDTFKKVNFDWLRKKNVLHNDRLFRVINLHLILPALRNLFSFSSKIALDLTDCHFKEKSTVYTSLYFETGSQQPLHRDTPYFHTTPPYRYMGFWIALEDTDLNNGCLNVVPRSHKIPEVDLVRLRHDILGNNECPSSDTELFNPTMMPFLKSHLTLVLRL